MRGPRFAVGGGLLPAVSSDVVSRALLHVRPDWASQNAQTGELLSITDHRFTFARGASLAGVATSDGGTYTASYAQIAWEPRTLYDSSARVGIRVTAADTFTSAKIPTAQALSLFAEFIIYTSPGTAYTVVSLSSASTADPALDLTITPTFYTLTWRTSSGTTRTSSIARTSADNGKLIVARGTLSGTGVVQLFIAIDGAAETAGTASAALALVAWATGTLWRLNQLYATASGLVGWIGGVKCVAGTPAAAIVVATW